MFRPCIGPTSAERCCSDTDCLGGALGSSVGSNAAMIMSLVFLFGVLPTVLGAEW